MHDQRLFVGKSLFTRVTFESLSPSMLFPFVGIQVARFFELSWAIFARVWPLVCVLSLMSKVDRFAREAFATVFANDGSIALTPAL